MMRKTGLVVALAVLVVAVTWARGATQVSSARSGAAVAMKGVVTAEAEGAMEGVLVSARSAANSRIRHTVVTDKGGQFAFPKSMLQPGRYRISTRAAGYDLRDPGEVEVKADGTAAVDLRLLPTRNLVTQLTNAEWRLSLPGPDEQKERIDCTGCHTMQRVIESKHGPQQWVKVLDRMTAYAPPAGAHAFPRGDGPKTPFATARNEAAQMQLAEYLASVNMSKGRELSYTLKTLPRPTGRGTTVAYTEYDLPRPEAQPHDAVVDAEGMVWYTDFAFPYIGVLNPRTGEIQEYKVPTVKGPEFPQGLLDIEIDKDGNPWVSMLFQGAIGKFDRQTKKLQIFNIPAKYNDVRARAGMIAVPRPNSRDQRIWFCDNTNRRMFRLDPATGHIDAFEAYPDEAGKTSDEYTLGGLRQQRSAHSIYGIAVDSQGNGWFADMAGHNMGKIDAKTGKSTLYKIPGPAAGPRRFWIDTQDRVWFAEYRRGGLGMLDAKTGEFKHWDVPSPFTKAYDVAVDKNGEVWGAGMWTDRVFRFNPKTETMTEYLLPSSTNTRRVDIDNRSDKVVFWTGSNHAAKLVRLEPLD